MSHPFNPASSASVPRLASNPPARRIEVPRRSEAPSRPLVDGSAIPDRTLCIAVDIKRVGNRRKVSSGQIEVDADREAISVSKQLLIASQWLDIVNYDTRIRRYLGSRCLPSLFRGGVFLLPISLVEEVDAELGRMAEHRHQLIGEFLGVYPDLVQAAQLRLRGLFDPQDYPPLPVVEAAFSFSWRYLALRVPDTLAVINHSIFQRERDKTARAWDEAATAIQALLRAEMVGLVEHMTHRLQSGEDGKPRCFKNSLVSNLAEFLKTFDARNVTDDRELAQVAQRARQLLEGVDPDVLRRSQQTRSEVQRGFNELKTQLDSMVANRPTRRIQLN